TYCIHPVSTLFPYTTLFRSNKIALDHLTKGADGIFFFSTTDIQRRLEKIDLKACTVSFPVSDHKNVEAIGQFLREQSDPQHINFQWESTPLLPWNMLTYFGRLYGVLTLGDMIHLVHVVIDSANTLFYGLPLICLT